MVNAAIKAMTKAKAIGAAAEVTNVWPRGVSGQDLASRTRSLANWMFDCTKF